MRSIVFMTISWLLVVSCVKVEPSRVDRIKAELQQSTSKNVMVVAHRGAWRLAPENSIAAIEECIEMGVDIVEIDVRKTKDQQLIVMHDGTIDRTTNGSGKVADYTLAELLEYYLKDHQGGSNAALTPYRIPTLEEALVAAKGKIMLNLDKAYGLMKDIYPLLQKTGTVDHVILKGRQTAGQIVEDLAFMQEPVFFMPILVDTMDSLPFRIHQHLEKYDPVGFEIVLRENADVMQRADHIQSEGARVWVNTLWDNLCLGHTDAKSLKDPDANWGWVIEKGANIIQTDHPEELINYLENKGLRNVEK